MHDIQWQAEIVALREEQSRIADLQRDVEARLHELEARSASAAASPPIVGASSANMVPDARFDLGDLKLYGGKIPQPFARTDLVGR